MILKLSKSLNDKNEYNLIAFNMYDNIDNLSLNKFDNNNIYESKDYYYYYIKDIIDIGECEKFKIKVKKGDIVSLTARDNSYIVYPSKKTFAIAFNLNYNKVLSYNYDEVLLDGVPYEVKYVTDNDCKVNDGVVYTLKQLVSYISTLIKGNNYILVDRIINDKNKSQEEEKINRIIRKYYSQDKNSIGKKYELNVKRICMDENNKWRKGEMINITKSNKHLYDYFLLRMFSYMILTKSKKDRETHNDEKYCFNREFNTLEEVYDFLEENQDIVNNFFIETEMLFSNPNCTFTGYAPYIDGVYMFYEYNNTKVYLYRNVDAAKFSNHSLKCTYVSTKFQHKIKSIKLNYSI